MWDLLCVHADGEALCSVVCIGNACGVGEGSPNANGVDEAVPSLGEALDIIVRDALGPHLQGILEGVR